MRLIILFLFCICSFLGTAQNLITAEQAPDYINDSVKLAGIVIKAEKSSTDDFKGTILKLKTRGDNFMKVYIPLQVDKKFDFVSDIFLPGKTIILLCRIRNSNSGIYTLVNSASQLKVD